MSHCTKFDFSYTSEEAIVKAFHKMGIKCSTEMICEFTSDFEKTILGNYGYMGRKQFRSIIGEIDGGHIYVCRVEENKYELFIEHHYNYGNNSNKDKAIAAKFRNAYIETAVDKVLRKLDLNAIRYEVNHQPNGLIVNFGPNLEYTLSVLTQDDSIIEDVSGVKGDFCTKLTEDIEDVLSHPSAELKTEWKAEVNMQVEDETLQVLSLSF